ncbi:SpoIIE family protein phosphatase [Agaribacterium haliotis]|uniref:SpoIIE family protein phosphatase n=1 Tax=Agaribacterium haliotis TaxID=2013869 RepID=UPI000BB532AD|nr:SpoIIE family protein phosphatase [Agaribacterium haliotis]
MGFSRAGAPSITSWLSLWLCSAIAVLVCLLLVLEYRNSSQYILKSSRLEAQGIIADVDLQIEELLSSVEHSVQTFAALFPQNELNEDALRQLLFSYLRSNAELFGAAVALNPEHPWVERAMSPYVYRQAGALEYKNLANNNYRYRQQSWFSEVQTSLQPYWSEPYFDRGGGDVLMATYSVPVLTELDGQQQLLAVLTSDVELKRLQQIVSQIKLGDSGFGMLFSRQGRVISHPDSSLLMRPFASVAPEHNREAWLAAEAELLMGQQGILNLPCPQRPVSCFVASKTLSESGWPMMIAFPEDEMFAPLNAYLWRLLLVACLALVVVVAVVWRIIASLTKPLASLAEHTQRIGAGDLKVPIDVKATSREVLQLSDAFVSMQRRLREYLDNLQAETALRSQFEAELSAARDIQLALLAGTEGRYSQSFDGAALWAHLIPARQVGGDLYFIQHKPGKVLVAVGDVSGKGMPAALFMARTLTLMSALGHQGLGLEALLDSLNKELCEDNDECMFVSLIVAELDTDSGEVSVLSAGHPEPILIGRQSQPLELDGGPALGLYDGAIYRSQSFQLGEAQQLLLYSDGIDEAFNASQECFGLPRLLQHLNAEALNAPEAKVGARGEALYDALEQFCAGAAQNDDRTALVLQWRPPSAFVSAPELTVCKDFIALDPGSAELTAFLVAVENWAVQVGASDTAQFALKLVAEELFMNCRHHAKAQFDLLLAVDERELVLEYRDTGPAFDPLQYQSSAGDDGQIQIGGLGLGLIKQFSRDLSYCHRYNKNILSLRLGLD